VPVEPQVWQGLVLIAAWLALAAARLLRPFRVTRTPVRRPVRRHRPAAATRRRAQPVPFSYWYALVPFEEGHGEKERPVLVLAQDGVTARVLKVTSRDRSGRANYRAVDTSRWDRPGDRAGSWLQTDRIIAIPVAGFRRRLGDEDDVVLRQELARVHAGVWPGRDSFFAS
jgi:hypothetical protein